jgi:hypothetical protein
MYLTVGAKVHIVSKQRRQRQMALERSLSRFRNNAGDFGGLMRRQRSKIGYGLPGDILPHKKRLVVLGVLIENRGNVGQINAHGLLRFAHQLLGSIGTGAGRYGFHHHGTI